MWQDIPLSPPDNYIGESTLLASRSTNWKSQLKLSAVRQEPKIKARGLIILRSFMVHLKFPANLTS